jgi:hypothetical protein
VLTQYRKLNTENIARSPPSCGEPLGEATDYKSPSSRELRKSLANPDMERKREKKGVI